MDRQTIANARAERSKKFPGEFPGGQQRVKSFPGKLQARLVDRDGKQFYHVDGFATVFERAYPMWDMFGEYDEIVDYGALSKSLAANPDVAWLVNHHGVTMARTANRTLELDIRTTPDGYQGLYTDAYLNPDRQDVRDIVSAIVDGLVDEMSFAFMLNNGEWNDDYTQFRITEADINRGDVSAVNYGANPFTSIQARTADILADLDRIPVPALERAQQKVASRILSSAAVDLSQRSADRYTRAAINLQKIARETGNGLDIAVLEKLDLRDFQVVDETGDDDPDDSAAALAKAVDAGLDTAVALLKNVDVTSLPPEVQQAVDLINGAEANIDQLLEVMNLVDPDDLGERSKRPAETRDGIKQRLDGLDKRDAKQEQEPALVIPPTGNGKSLKLWQSRLSELTE